MAEVNQRSDTIEPDNYSFDEVWILSTLGLYIFLTASRVSMSLH